MRRREFIAGIGGAAIWPRSARAQGTPKETGRVWKVGILWHAANLEEEQVMFGPLAEGLRELGYVEGRNVVFDHTYVDENYDRFQARAQELVDRKVDIILASVAAAAIAAGKVTKTVPIVFATSGDPVRLGLVDSIRQPRGNVTGLSLFWAELISKHLEILRDLIPGLSRVAILWNPANEDHPSTLKAAESAAQVLGLQTVQIGVKGPGDFSNAFASIAKADVGGLVVVGDAMLRVNRKEILAFTASNRLPAVYGPRQWADDGGLVAHGVCVPCNFRRSAAFVDKILKGAKPTELPVEQPTRFELVINLKTAKALGLTIPATLLARADEVIE